MLPVQSYKNTGVLKTYTNIQSVPKDNGVPLTCTIILSWCSKKLCFVNMCYETWILQTILIFGQVLRFKKFKITALKVIELLNNKTILQNGLTVLKTLQTQVFSLGSQGKPSLLKLGLSCGRPLVSLFQVLDLARKCLKSLSCAGSSIGL